MAIKSKKVIVAFDQGEKLSLFYRMYKMLSRERSSRAENAGAELDGVRADIARYSAQMHRQQDHIDEIKRLCHVPVDL